MIRGLQIVGFKRFKDQSFQFGQLTVLSGSNGAGKTTVLHSLLIARQAAAQGNRGHVELDGPYGLSLGEAGDVLQIETDAGAGIQINVNDGASDHRFRFSVPDKRSLRLMVLEGGGTSSLALAAPQKMFTYLCAERLGPRDILEAVSLDENDLNVGPRGEATAQVLAQLELVAVREAMKHPRTEELGSRTTLPVQTELWLSSIVREMQVDARWIPATNATTLRFREPGVQGEWLRPANVGFGLTYALPVIVAGLVTPADSLLIVENPEAHLHPRGQSAIGEFLARVAASGVQVVIETHSDHVLNGIRRAVAISRTIPADDVFICHFRSSDGAPAIDQITVRPNGELSLWPEGFFDQIEQDLADLSRARRSPP